MSSRDCVQGWSSARDCICGEKADKSAAALVSGQFGWKGPYSSGIKALRPLRTPAEGLWGSTAAVGSDMSIDSDDDETCMYLRINGPSCG